MQRWSEPHSLLTLHTEKRKQTCSLNKQNHTLSSYTGQPNRSELAPLIHTHTHTLTLTHWWHDLFLTSDRRWLKVATERMFPKTLAVPSSERASGSVCVCVSCFFFRGPVLVSFCRRSWLTVPMDCSVFFFFFFFFCPNGWHQTHDQLHEMYLSKRLDRGLAPI